MKKKTIIISGIATVLVIGSVVFCFAVKGDSTQPAEVAQTVTEAVSTPTIEIPEEEPEVVEEVPEVEVVEVVEETPEVEETTEVEETSSEVSIVEVAETSPEVSEVSEDAGVSTEAEETKPEQAQPVETKPVETQPVETKPNVNQISADEASQALIAQLTADGAVWGDTPATSTLGETAAFNSAALDVIVE